MPKATLFPHFVAPGEVADGAEVLVAQGWEADALACLTSVTCKWQYPPHSHHQKQLVFSVPEIAWDPGKRKDDKPLMAEVSS
jgi:glutamate 5-kinase